MPCQENLKALNGEECFHKLLQRFPSTSELAVWTQGDLIVLKRLKPLPLSKIAERMPEEEMPLEDIGAEVHQLRQEKRP